MDVLIGILMPFLGTVIGSFMVFFLKKNLNKKCDILIMGFAAGVMVAASIWSLIIPALEVSVLSVIIGFTLGILLFWLIDFVMLKKDLASSYNKMMFAITLHNIPEGMAVGTVLASFIAGDSVSILTCYVLCLGVAIQNFPEGIVVSLPLYKSGFSKGKAFLYGCISAVFELLGAVFTLFFASFVNGILPFLFAFAAGAMVYVVIVELIPESKDNSNVNVIGFMLGFLIMMILDVMLG